MERMGPLDAEFLAIEEGVAHMHIAGCSIFEGPVPSQDEILEMFRAALPRLPRYRQRVRTVPLGLGRPVWVDDPHFDLEYHVRRTALPEPGSHQELAALVGRLMSQELDRRRPLWEAWIVEGLTGDRWAAVSKVHHCMVDGIAGTDLMAALLDLTPDAPLEPVDETWEPEPEPSGPELVLDAWRGLAEDVWEMVQGVPGLARHPSRAVDAVADAARGVIRLGGEGGTRRRSSLDASIGPHRRYDWVTLALEDIKRTKDALGGTVNDVVLAAVTGGFRELLQERNEDPDDVRIRTLVPISVRTTDEQGAGANRVSGSVIELPVHVADPRERLQVVRGEMARVKESHEAEMGELAIAAAELAPPFALSLATRVLFWFMNRVPGTVVDTVTTNVPGPQFPLYVRGREMLEWLPVVPLAQGVQIGVAILSYNGRVSFGLSADYDGAPDLRVLASGIERGLRELGELAGVWEAESEPG